MTHRNVIGTTLAYLCICGSLLLDGNVWAQPAPVPHRDDAAVNMEKRGRMALEAQQYQEALELFSEASAQARDPGLKARLDFRQAVTLQQMANTASPEDSADLLQRAARLYHAYLKQNPKSTATANNLARIYATLGDTALQASDTERARGYFSRADGYYKTAVSASDASQGLYLKNYAEFLERTGQWAQAKEAYAQLVQGYPVSPSLQKALTATYREHGLGDMVEYLWNLQDAGYTRQSAGIALDSLQQSANETDDHRIELLTIVCTALAQETDDRNSFAESGAGRQITALGADTFIGKGAAEIADLYRGDKMQRWDYEWWRERRLGWQDPGRGLYPIDGFRALIRSLGSRSKLAGDRDMAEAYFRLAAGIHEYEVDPVAIRDLVRMYAEGNEIQKINGVLNDFQIQLYAGKGDAYRNSHVEKIFQYHQTLGDLYTLVERWGDSNRVDSAIFQLEHARTASTMLSEKLQDKLPETYRFTPQMVDQLSMGYEKTGRIDKSLQLRIDQAEIYKKAGDMQDARRVLSPIEKAEIPANLPNHYRSLLESNISDGLINIQPEIENKVESKNKLDLKGKTELKDHQGSVDPQ